ncbi:hypothetical protein FXF50_00420 [Micromonospora sp. AP08]|uniref:hypothetical protein n=1 Tax=Micromonospora sp. AP08 TaxID=2604467 RepID=UPI0011D3313A|nr:hypothetical protein FXF50_00420 [Micromonospora sp. AP08]
MLRSIVGHLAPIGVPLLVAVDDTMFRRCGRKVYAAYWGYDGSSTVAKGNQKLSRGNTFVVAAVIVALPFPDRPVALPVLTRLWRKSLRYPDRHARRPGRPPCPPHRSPSPATAAPLPSPCTTNASGADANDLDPGLLGDAGQVATWVTRMNLTGSLPSLR